MIITDIIIIVIIYLSALFLVNQILVLENNSKSK